MLRHTIRAGRLAIGVALLLIGALLALPGVPGPGLVVVFGGLTVLSVEFEWARRLRDRMRDAARRLMRRSDA